MKKQTKITQDKTQTRATIPKVFVDKFKVKKEDEIEWSDDKNKLKGELKNKYWREIYELNRYNREN